MNKDNKDMNDNKDFFDYDTYIKSTEKNKSKNKGKKNSGAKNGGTAKNNKPAQEKTKFVPADNKVSGDNKKKTDVQDKPVNEKKTENENKPSHENKMENNKQGNKNKPANGNKNNSRTQQNNKRSQSEGKKRQDNEEKKKAQEEKLENIKYMLDDALSEDAEEMAALVQSEPQPEIAVEKDPQGIKRKLYMVFGAAIIILAVIGLISTINFSVKKINEFADNTHQKNEFARFIYPIVICDPAPFDQTVRLRSDTMITAAIWDIILYEDKSKYEKDFDYIIVPELDVEQHATKLFGSGQSFKHESILSADIQFYYEEDIKSYRIPENPKYFTYSPYIEDITRVGESYTITVGYVSPTPAWLTLTSDEPPQPEKYVEYVVSVRNGEYTLVAIQESDIKTDRQGL